MNNTELQPKYTIALRSVVLTAQVYYIDLHGSSIYWTINEHSMLRSYMSRHGHCTTTGHLMSLLRFDMNIASSLNFPCYNPGCSYYVSTWMFTAELWNWLYILTSNISWIVVAGRCATFPEHLRTWMTASSTTIDATCEETFIFVPVGTGVFFVFVAMNIISH